MLVGFVMFIAATFITLKPYLSLRSRGYDAVPFYVFLLLNFVLVSLATGADLRFLISYFFTSVVTLSLIGWNEDLGTRWSGTAPVRIPKTKADVAPEPQDARQFDYAAEWDSWKDQEIPCWNPATGRFLGVVPRSGPGHVAAMMTTAREAQERWKASTFPQRRLMMRTLSRFIVENTETICMVVCKDSGKTRLDCVCGDIMPTLEKLRWIRRHGENALGSERRGTNPMDPNKSCRVEYVPVGVVAAIVACDCPFYNLMNALIAAVFAGNSVIIKPSEYTAWCSQYMGRAIRKAFEAIEAPLGLVQIVNGLDDLGTALIESVDKVVFIGSSTVGSAVLEKASRALTPAVLELGGKDAVVVCDDADLEDVSRRAVREVFQNCGQNRFGPERFLVYEKVYEEFCDRCTALARTLRQGPPVNSEGDVDCGACAHPSSIRRYEALVEDAVSRGARPLCGGKPNAALPGGQFFEPTVLCGVTEDMLISREEIFGPILAISCVKDNLDDEAVRMSNNPAWARAACVHAGLRSRASKICARVHTGVVAVNDFVGSSVLSQSLPLGGSRDPGSGRLSGKEGLRGLCVQRSVIEPGWSIMGCFVPRPLSYPVSGDDVRRCQALSKALYGDSLSVRYSGVRDLCRRRMGGSVG